MYYALVLYKTIKFNAIRQKLFRHVIVKQVTNIATCNPGEDLTVTSW